MAQSTKTPPKPKQSELRQRFEKYCKENPWAPECKIYES